MVYGCVAEICTVHSVYIFNTFWCILSHSEYLVKIWNYKINFFQRPKIVFWPQKSNIWKKFQISFSKNFPKKSSFYFLCSECINVYQNMSKCFQNELCKTFVHEIIKVGFFTTFKVGLIDDLLIPLCGWGPCTLPEKISILGQ